METGVVNIQEPVSTKTNVGEAPAGVILDNSSMEVQKVNLSTILDDEITSGDSRNSIIPGETDVSDIVNGSGNIETEELKHEKGEATKTSSVVEDSKIVSETEKDEHGSIFVHKPESLNKDIEDAKTISSDVTLEKEKETGKPEEVSVQKPVIEEDHTETKDLPKQEDEIGSISKASEEIPIKTDEVKEEKDSRDLETTVNGREAEHNATVSVEEISRNGDNIVNETVPEKETATVIETTERVIPELEKEEETKIVEEPRLDAMEKVETEIVKTVIEDPEIVYKEETAVLEPVSLKEIAEPVESIKTSDDAEKISSEVTVDKGKEEDIIQNTEEVQESPRVIETPTIQGEDIESKASLDHEVKSKEIVPEKETAIDGESLHETETTKRVLPEAEKEEDKEEMKTADEPSLNVIEEVETANVKTVTDDPEIVNNEETTVHDTKSLKENAEPVEAIKSSEEITQNTEEIQVNPSLIGTSKIQGEDNESKVSLNTKEEVDHSSNETEEHEHMLGRDLPQCETLEVEAVESKEERKPSLDLKEDKEKEETETVKTVISSNEVSSSTVQEEFGEHTEPGSSEIKDESHGREESVEVKSKETVQDENTAEKHKDLLDVSPTETEKYQENEPETTIVADTKSHEKFEESPSDLALNVDKEEQNDEKIKVDQFDGTQVMEEQRGLDSNGVEADRNGTDETEECSVAKQVSLPDVEPVEQMQKSSLDSPSQVSEETVDAKIDEKPEEEKGKLHQEDQEEGSYGLDTKRETVSVPESIEIGEKSLEERNVIDLTPLQEESSQTNEKKEETKLEKHELTNEEFKSDEVIEVSSTLLPKELEGETVVEAEKIENNKENEEEAAAVDNLESHNSLPSSSEEQEHGTVSEKIEDEKVEEEPMVQIKSHERQEEVSKAVEEQTIDMEPSLTEKCSRDQNQPEEQVKEACSRDEQEKEISSNSETIVNETYDLHSAEAEEEETATNGESLHDLETTRRVLLEVEKEEEEAETKTDAEPMLDVTEKKELETAKTVVEDIEIVNNEEATSHESETLKGDDHQGENAESLEAIKNSDGAEKLSREVTGDREKDQDITQKAEEVQERPRVIEIPTIQGEENEFESSLELKEEVYQSSKDTEQHQHVSERDIPQCETLEAEAAHTSTVQEAAILNTLETNISESEAVHSEMGGAEEGQEKKVDTETSLDLKVDIEQKEAETVKTVIFSDEVKSSDQAEEHTKPYTLEIKTESQGREESVEIKSKDTVQDESSEEKDVNLPDVRSGESEKYKENEPVTSLVSKTESVDKFEEIPSSVEGAGLNESAHNQTLVDVESIEKVQNPSLETPHELSEQTSETVDEVTLHQEGQEEGYNGVETKEETVSVPESRQLGEKAQEEESCLQNEQKKEVKLQEEQMYKHEPTKEEVSSDQQSPVEEKSDDVIQVSSASPSEGPEDETVVKAEKIGEEQVADKMTVETSSLLSSSEEQEHAAVPEKTDGEEVKEAEPIGDMREKGLEIAETTHLSLPTIDQKEDVKAFDEEIIQIPTATLPLEDQEKVTSTEKGETKANETEDDKPDEHVASSTLPMFSEKHDDETQIAEAEKRDEEITVGTSKTSENVCIQQDEFEKPEATKLEELKEDKSQEIAETIKEIEDTSDQTLPSQADNTPSSELVSEQEDQTPKQFKDIYEEEHKVEAMDYQNLPVETLHAYQTQSADLISALNDQTPKHIGETHEEETKEEHKLQAEEILPTETLQVYQTQSADLISALNDQTPKHVEETHEEETKEEHKLQAYGILPTETIPRESSDDALVSMLASKDTQEEQPVSVERAESVGETKPKEPEDEIRDEHVETPSIILEKNDNETLIAEAKKGDEDIDETENMSLKQEDFGNPEAPKLEESKEQKFQEIPETDKAIDATGDQSLPFETSQEYKTSSSDLALKQVEEVHEEETKEEQKLQVAVDQILLVETSQADQIPSLASEQDDQIPKHIEEILEEETKEARKVQADDILSTKTVESFSESPLSMLASGEDEPVTPQEGNCAGDTLEEKVGETKPKESEAEGTEKSDDLVETSTKLTKVEDAASTKKTDVEVAELTNDYPTEEAENGDEAYSTLPVVGILTELQNTLETERTINDSASKGDNMTKEPAGVESNEKDSATGIIEANKLQQDESGESEKIQEENGLPEESLPIEEVNLQEEHKEEVKVQDRISRDFEVNNEEKLQEGTREVAEYKEEIPSEQSITELPGEKSLISSSVLPSEEPEDVISPEKQEECEPQEDINASKSEKISVQEEQKDETHETVEEEDQVVDIKDEKKDDEEQEIVSSEVNRDKEDASELGVGNDFVSRDVEKEEVPHGVLENEEEINEVVKSEKQITDPVGIITKDSEAEPESNQEPVETQAISDDTKRNDNRDLSTEEAQKVQREEVSADKYLTKEVLSEQLQVPSSTALDDLKDNNTSEADCDLSVQKSSELIQSHQSHNLPLEENVEEASFGVKNAQDEENGNALITNENLQVQEQPKDFEAPAIEKEISEQELKSNDPTHVQEDIGTDVKPEIHDEEIRADSHDSVVMPKEETGLLEEKREVEHVKTEPEDAIKHEVAVEEKNKTSENIDRQTAKENYQQESKPTYTIKEDIRKEEKESDQESFENVKKTDDAIEKIQPEIQDIESLSSVSKTQDNAEQKDEVPNQQEMEIPDEVPNQQEREIADEVPNQQKREIADEVPKLENQKISEEVQQKDGEPENTKDLFSEVKETEPTLKEPARKSLSDLIQKVKGTNKTEDVTTEPHIEEEPKTVEEDENDNGDHEHDKDDKTSPDSIVMVEAKDTVSIIKTHKKSQGILSGVGSKVKHSISKVKKVLTGKSSHTTKPSSPK
ncbi:PREDICTED: A-kinase anchor protein 9-like [Camelina sativa]|uniref:A-kinase anchor protein 9-like n=1 Tax=Camelina sativa TaxID=90675 RepID=A0ABM0V4L1_CAMSA|nr:PREDICTED: A-kinase anchor protein 9-like [Camelina sativa]